MKTNRLRLITALLVAVIITVGFLTNIGLGTISAVGWFEISILCPLGALGTMLASKMLVPQAVISIIFAVLFIALFARAFCAWICPIPLVQKLRGLFSKKKDASSLSKPKELGSASDAALGAARDAASDAIDVANTIHALETSNAESCENEPIAAFAIDSRDDDVSGVKALSSNKLKTPDNKFRTPAGCSSQNCNSCKETKGRVLDSRHFVLGGSLLSAAIFGFPVFCLICPIGLSFATIILVIRLFSGGDVTLSLLIVPLILIVEVVVFRKWCGKLCPLSAFMSLIGKVNRTFRPTIKDETCIEISKGTTCEVCAKVCPEGLNPRHPEQGSAWSECTLCRECVDACPTKSITTPWLPVKKNKQLIKKG